MSRQDVIVPDQSLADIQRRRFARPMVPHVLTLPCPMPTCRGVMCFTGRSFQDGMGPTVYIHMCDTCGARQDIAEDHYPRIEYRDHDGRPINMANGRTFLR